MKDIKGVRRQATDWEKIFSKYTSDKGLLFKKYKEHLNSKIRKPKILLKNGQKTWKYTSPEKTYRWQVITWNYISHHMSPGKCKLKQWDTTTHLRMAKIWNTDNTKCWWECVATAILIHCWWKCKMARPLWKKVCRYLTKLSWLSPYDLAIVLLGIYHKELKIYVHTKTCTWMLIAALLIIAKTWKQQRCL